MRIFPLGWELTAFLVVVAAVSAGLLSGSEQLTEGALFAVVILTPLVILGAVLRAVTLRRD